MIKQNQDQSWNTITYLEIDSKTKNEKKVGKNKMIPPPKNMEVWHQIIKSPPNSIEYTFVIRYDQENKHYHNYQKWTATAIVSMV